jgi:hypothetical protein
MKFQAWLKKRIMQETDLTKIGDLATRIDMGINSAKLEKPDQPVNPQLVAGKINKEIQQSAMKSPGMKAVKVDAQSLTPLIQAKELENKKQQMAQGTTGTKQQMAQGTTGTK